MDQSAPPSRAELFRRAALHVQSESKVIDQIPQTTKIIILDSELQVQHAYSVLSSQGYKCGPVWDSTRERYAGMQSISDFVEVQVNTWIRYKEQVKLRATQPQLSGDEEIDLDIPSQRIVEWQEEFKDRGTSIPYLLTVPPQASLLALLHQLLASRVHRLAVSTDPLGANIVGIVSQHQLLGHQLAKCMMMKCETLGSPYGTIQGNIQGNAQGGTQGGAQSSAQSNTSTGIAGGVQIGSVQGATQNSAGFDNSGVSSETTNANAELNATLTGILTATLADSSILRRGRLFTVCGDTPALDAAEILLTNKIGSVPVVEGSWYDRASKDGRGALTVSEGGNVRATGLFSRADVLGISLLGVAESIRRQVTVSEVLAPQQPFCTENEQLLDTCKTLFLLDRHQQVCVDEQGRLVGVVALIEIFSYIVKWELTVVRDTTTHWVEPSST